MPNSEKPLRRLLTVRRQFQLLRLQIRYTPEALQIIEANATERKRGEFVSNAVVAYANGGVASGDAGILERMESRLARIEKLLMSRSA